MLRQAPLPQLKWGPNAMYLDYVLEQLGELGPVTSRAMFGGHIDREESLAAVGEAAKLPRGRSPHVYRDRLYFKTDDASRAEYEARDSEPFRPNARQTLKSYWEVPADVVEDPELAVDWAREAVACAAAGRALH